MKALSTSTKFDQVNDIKKQNYGIEAGFLYLKNYFMIIACLVLLLLHYFYRSLPL